MRARLADVLLWRYASFRYTRADPFWLQYTACLHTLKHDRRATRCNSKEEQAIRISKLGIKPASAYISFHTSDGSIPLQTWTPHHSGAHRSDTPTLLHSFGRHPIPPRAYTLHQERSKQQGKRRERRPAEIVPRRANQSTAATEEVKSVVFCFFGSSSKKKQEFTH